MSKSRIMWASPRNASEEDDPNAGQGDLGAILNNLNDDGTDPNADQNTDVDPGSNAGDGDSDPGTDEQGDPGQSSADKAFANMRIQNKTLQQQNQAMTDMLKKFADANGINVGDNVLDALNDDALEKIAKRDNVPKEYLQRMEKLEGENSVARKERLQRGAVDGFQKVAQQYSLDQAKLEQFAAEMDQAGINPFEQEDVDIIAEYQRLHYDEILEARVQAEVRKILDKDSAADQHSSTPNKNTGGPAGEKEKVTSVSGLRSVLSNINL